MNLSVAQTPPPDNTSKEPKEEGSFKYVEKVNDSRELSWLIQNGDTKMYLVNFYMPGDNHDDVRKDLEKKVGTNTSYKDKVTYVEVNAARTYEFRESLQEAEIYNEPAKLYPYVMLVKKGIGYIFRGPEIGDAVLDKISTVNEGKVKSNA